LLFPITHGTLFFPWYGRAATYAVYGTGQITAEDVAAAKATWRLRLERLFETRPSLQAAKRRWTIRTATYWQVHVAIGQSGVAAHVEEMQGVPQTLPAPRAAGCALETGPIPYHGGDYDIQYAIARRGRRRIPHDPWQFCRHASTATRMRSGRYGVCSQSA